MKLGIRIPGAGPWAGPDEISTVARRAEEMGFDSLWMTDHIALPTKIDTPYPYRADGKFLWPSDTPYLDTLMALSWAAAATTRVTVGTSVLILPWRPIVHTAKALVSIDVLSKGRFVLGVGVGWMKEQFAFLGASFADRGPRTNEAIRLLRHFWTEPEVDFHGEFHDYSGFRMYPKPVNGTIPVWTGGYSPASLRRAASVADGWHPLALGPEDYATHLATLKRLVEENGRSMDEIELSARPLYKAPYEPSTLEAYAELGVTHFVCDTSFEHPTLTAALDELEQLAAKLLPSAHALP